MLRFKRFPDISLRRVGFIEIRSTQPIVLASESFKSVAASAGERAVRGSIVGHSLNGAKVPGHLLCEERRVYRDKKHPANRAGFRKLEVRCRLCGRAGCDSLNRWQVADRACLALRSVSPTNAWWMLLVWTRQTGIDNSTLPAIEVGFR